MKTYHIAFVKGTGRTRHWANGHRGDTLVMQARRNVDDLDCEAWKYMGEHITTKAGLRARLADGGKFLTWINGKFGTTFTRVVVD